MNPNALSPVRRALLVTLPATMLLTAMSACSSEVNSDRESTVVAANDGVTWSDVNDDQLMIPEDVCEKGFEVKGDPNADPDNESTWHKAVVLRTARTILRRHRPSGVLFTSGDYIGSGFLDIDEQFSRDPENSNFSEVMMLVGPEDSCFSFAGKDEDNRTIALKTMDMIETTVDDPRFQAIDHL